MKIFLCLLMLLCAHVYGAQIHITGKAASTLFICDNEAVFNCWFECPYTHCILKVEEESKTLVTASKELLIQGKLATNIYQVTNNCHDGDRDPYKFFYREGIECYQSNDTDYVCLLSF